MSINYGESVKKYLNQTAVWEKCTGHDEYGKAVYAEGADIAVRKVPMQKLVTDNFGRQTVSKMTVLCREEISVEDLIDGERVMAVEWCVDRWGKGFARSVLV